MKPQITEELLTMKSPNSEESRHGKTIPWHAHEARGMVFIVGPGQDAWLRVDKEGCDLPTATKAAAILAREQYGNHSAGVAEIRDAMERAATEPDMPEPVLEKWSDDIDDVFEQVADALGVEFTRERICAARKNEHVGNCRSMVAGVLKHRVGWINQEICAVFGLKTADGGGSIVRRHRELYAQNETYRAAADRLQCAPGELK